MADSLAGKVAIVTGGSRGIGAAIGRRLAADGAAVVVASRNAESVQAAVVALESGGSKALGVPADVSRPADLDRVYAAAIEAFGGVDILVNNAAVSPDSKPIQDTTVDEWDGAFATLLRSCWYLSKLVHPSMKARGGGSIVNISSVGAYYHREGQMLYNLPKAALFKLTQDCAVEWAPDNIRVNCVAPGWVQTDMAADSIAAMRSGGQKPNLLDRVADPDEVAGLVAYLVSDEARLVTAEVIRIDGGGRPGWL